jgi:hypothetical protein
MAAVLDHIGGVGLGQVRQILWPQAKHTMGMPGSRPNFVETPQILIE